MSIKSFIITLIILTFGAVQVQATPLPKQIKDLLQAQKKIPTVRSDSVIVYSKDVMYLPVIPAYPDEVDKLEVVRTYPENKTLSDLPDMVLFNNNYGLLKVVRMDENSLTINNIPELPVEIKTGSFPQDMMVPRGLILPENLAGILGDVQVPLRGSAKATAFVSGSAKKSAPLPNGDRIPDNKIYNTPVKMKNILFYVNNFQTEYLQVFSSTVTEPLYSLKTSGVVKDVKPVLDGKYLLAATSNKKNVDVIDVAGEYITKNIDLTAFPSEIAVDDANGKAYVASVNDDSLFVIDLNTMKMKEKIQLAGAPQRLSISSDGKKIAYLDMKTSNVYLLDMEGDEYENKLITNYPNTTKLILDGDYIYLIARTKPKLRIVQYDLLQDNKITKSKKDKKREKLNKSEEKKLASDVVTSDLYTRYDYIEELEDDEEKENGLFSEQTTYSTSIKDVNVGKKPIDMYKYNGNIYVLCADDNSVYSFNTSTNGLKSDKLPMEGFSKSFSPVPNSNLAVITNMADLKYVVYDLDKEKSIQAYPISEYVNSITILERKDGK